MLKTLEPVRPLMLTEMYEARRRIAKSVVRTPLVRLDLGPGFPDIRLKLENLQPTNSYKLRGAVNAVAMLSESERQLGVCHQRRQCRAGCRVCREASRRALHRGRD